MFEFSFEFCSHWRSESVSAHWERLLSDCNFLAPARKTTVHLHLHFQMCIEPVSPILSTEVFRSTPEFFLSTPNRTQTRTGPFSIHLAFSVFPHNNTWNWTNNVLFIGHRLNTRGLNPSCDIWLWVGGFGLDNVTDQIRPTHTHTHTLHQTRNPCLVDRQTAHIYTLCQRLVPKLKWAHLNQIWQSDSSEKQTLNCAESVVAQRGNNHSCRIYITRQFLRL